MMFMPKPADLLEHQSRSFTWVLYKTAVEYSDWNVAIPVQPLSQVSFIPFLQMEKYRHY